MVSVTAPLTLPSQATVYRPLDWSITAGCGGGPVKLMWVKVAASDGLIPTLAAWAEIPAIATTARINKILFIVCSCLVVESAVASSQLNELPTHSKRLWLINCIATRASATHAVERG